MRVFLALVATLTPMPLFALQAFDK